MSNLPPNDPFQDFPEELSNEELSSKNGDDPLHILPERPLECTECKRPISLRYTEIVGKTVNEICMCAECPHYIRRLQGLTQAPATGGTEVMSLTCGNCRTTLESLKVGNLLGCSVCYEVFEELILTDLQLSDWLPPRLQIRKKSSPIHIGRSPAETVELSPSSRLLALNEALNETLKREDYEQAALLRDQIKALTQEKEKKDE